MQRDIPKDLPDLYNLEKIEDKPPDIATSYSLKLKPLPVKPF